MRTGDGQLSRRSQIDTCVLVYTKRSAGSVESGGKVDFTLPNSRSTRLPSDWSSQATLRPLRRLCSTVSVQYLRLIRGATQHDMHPCQKHQSVNEADFTDLQARSGVPGNEAFRRQPLNARYFRKRPTIASTVLRFPYEAIARMLRERDAGGFVK